jgi:hypothetical protein
VEGARIVDRYRDREQYLAFLDIYTPMADPFLHEARVHLFRRDVLLERARDAEPGDKRRRDFATAYWENRILEDYFGELVRASSYHWPAGLEAEVRNSFRTDRPYDSWVSRHLITTFSRRQIFWLFLGAVIGLLLLGSWFGRRRHG